jgi:prepilin-type N-terminal cleavage/methylation domain-containing protein
MRRSGFTLMELLIVIAIIALLAALLWPVFQQARKKSYEPVCINNLRQFHVAFSLYREDYGDTARYQALLLPYIRDTRVLHCRADTYKHGAAFAGSDKGDKWIKTSYYYYRPFSENFIDLLRRADPNHGIAVCILHGKWRNGRQGPGADFDYVGRVLRLRMDGSVSNGYAEILCYREFPDSPYPTETRHPWYLYTDIRPIPQEVIDTDLYLRGKEYWPCE